MKHVFLSLVLFAALGASLVGAAPASAATHTPVRQSGLTPGQQAALYAIAHQTWRFFDADTDPNTHLPMDNLGLYGAPSGPYTSPTNIGVYFWSVVAAHDLGFIDYRRAARSAIATLSSTSR